MAKMSESALNMPIGFRFDPTDEELISGFLLPRVTGRPLPWNGFLERDLYGENAAPWEVFGDVDESSPFWHAKREGDNFKGFKKTIYVFTKLTKFGSNSNSKRVSRRAGCGTWNGQTGPKKIKDSINGEIIGTTRMLTFQHSKTVGTNSSETGSFGHWIMHEYALDGRCNNDIVLCKITKCLNLKEGDRRRLQLPTSDDGGASGIQISTAAGNHEAEPSKKRSAGECQEGDGFDQKKQKLCNGNCGDDDASDPFVGFDDVIDFDDLLEGFEGQFQNWSCSNDGGVDDMFVELNTAENWTLLQGL